MNTIPRSRGRLAVPVLVVLAGITLVVSGSSHDAAPQVIGRAAARSVPAAVGVVTVPATPVGRQAEPGYTGAGDRFLELAPA